MDLAMRLTRVGAIALAGIGAIGLTPVGAIGLAHHSVLAFDGAVATSIEGVVVRVLWQNPHTLIAIDSVAGSERWIVESEGMTALRRLGWTKDSLKNGDRIAVTGARAKDGRRLMRCKTISKDGRELPCFGASS